ncbi:sugar transporter [Rhodovulum visakhapatnamense]|uniref:Sugar transporter n=1 Tax=Rhodovulum visakhapatnamense TaxID=364297 RepID=A0ABS1RA80_9RHOB|nr:sugar transporter [Rhodovulum visakhapatnamense]
MPKIQGGQSVTHEISETDKDRARLRHRLMRLGLAVVVVLPTVVAALYLWLIAADQYHSDSAFSVRSEDYSNPLEALSVFTQVGSSSGSDSQILYDFIRSQPLMQQVDADLDLRALFGKQPSDLVFSLERDASREDMLDYWQRMVKVAVDPLTGVLSLQVRAFAPEDAEAIAQSILAQSGRMVDDLSRIARQDAIRFALEDLEEAEVLLRDVRRKVRVFRLENDIIDPTEAAQSQMGVIAALEGELASALVERETITSFAGEEDQRVKRVDRRIEAVRSQIDQERRRIGRPTSGPSSLVDAIGSYEELLVDLEFAQRAYTAALAASEQARAEARRTNRYLAVHIPPTLAEDSLYPQRGLLILLVLICSLAVYFTGLLIYYNVRDRG